MPVLRLPRQSGFTLIETLIALAVTAVGLLGMASLQVAALSGTQSSHQRTQAAFLAYDLTDRMRNNLGSLRTGGYDLELDTVPATATCRGEAQNCGAADVAASDISEWRAMVSTTLVAGNASVVTDTPPGSAVTDVTITITWVDSRTLPGNDGQEQLVYDITM